MTAHRLSSTALGYILALVAGIIWALVGPGYRFLFTTYHTPALTLVFWNVGIVAVAIMAWMLFDQDRKHLRGLSWADWGRFALVGGVFFGLYAICYSYSLAINGAALGTVLLHSAPAFITLGAAIFLRERPGAAQIIGVLLALAGSSLLMRLYDPSTYTLSRNGIIIGALSVLGYAAYMLVSQPIVTRYGAATSLGLTMLFGTITLGAAALIFDGVAAVFGQGTDLTFWGVMLGMSLLSSLGGWIAFYAAMRYLPASTVSLLIIIETPVVVLIALFGLHEQVESWQFVGIALIIAALVLPGIAEARRHVDVNA